VSDIAVCRAVWSDESIVPIAARWLRPSGALLWMRARSRGLRSVVPVRATSGELVFEGEHTYSIGDRTSMVWVFRQRPHGCFT
jgi:hypothetical protein